MEFLLLILMFYFHILDDYKLQGVLASMKQKSWWEKQDEYSSFYAKDFMMALFEHGMCWAISISMPLMFYELFINNLSRINYIFIVIVINMLCHIIIDDLKANKKKINLVTDQLLHFCQISLTWFFYFFI